MRARELHPHPGLGPRCAPSPPAGEGDEPRQLDASAQDGRAAAAMSEAVLHAPPALAARIRLRHKLLAINLAAVAVVLGLWWVSTALEWVAPIFLPSPGDVIHAARRLVVTG